MDNRFFVTQSNVISGQSKGCWFVLQFRNWRLLLKDVWPRDPHKGAWLCIYVAAPWNTPSGYLDRRYGVELSHPFGRRKIDLTVVLP